MRCKSLIFLIIMICSTSSFFAQETAVFTEAQEHFKRATNFFDKGLYGQSQVHYQKTIDLLQPINEPAWNDLKMEAELHYARAAVRLNQADGEKRIIDFVRLYSPDPLASEAIIEVANFYYNDKNYDKAFQFLSMIDTYNLSDDQKSEVVFKKGYVLFVRKKFSQAKSQFSQIRDIQNQYYYPSNYYLGMCHFFNGKYDLALESFNRVEKSKKYKNVIPYYKTQIYFAEGDYEQVLEYGLPQIANRSNKNQKELHQLVGQAYFELGEYSNALPYLEYYASKSNKMREEDFYQLGFTQYKTQNYRQAIKNLKELSEVDNALGQNALYILGDAYLKNNERSSARSAFANAMRMKHDRTLQREAQWNYAKLSYELKYDREAINTLQKIKPESSHYDEAQTIMSAIFLNTRDYERAMQIIDDMPTKTPKIRETYQRVAYYRGIQLYKDGNTDAARTYFLKSLETPLDSRVKALANYWLGDIAHQEKDYSKSNNYMDKFLPYARGVDNLPDESSRHTANYIVGYNYLKKKQYNKALNHFKETVSGIERERQYIDNEYITDKMLGDAIMRTGDCYFKQNQYDSAINYYQEAIDRRYNGYIYATYQLAIIEGLRGNKTAKIIALENVVKSSPESEYADDALLNLGITYQEMGKFNEAAKPLRKLIDDYKSSPLYNQALLSLGLITFNQGDYNQAIRYYKDVFKSNPNEKEATAALSALEEIYVDVLGKPDDYFRFLETVEGYTVGEDDKESISYRAAETQFENGEYQRAIEGYKNYLAKYPSGSYSLQATYNIAESYAVLKQYSPALNYYEKIIALGQSRFYGKALNKAALIAYNHEQDFQKSYEYYQLLELVADNADLRFDAQIGALRSAYRINDTNAVYSLANKVRNNPQASKEQIAAANFYIGKIALDRDNLDEALAAFNDVIRNSDNEQTAEARYSVAYIYYKQRELEIAKRICINANKESSNYQYWVAKSVILLSDILAEQGDLFNAKAALEALIENYFEDQSLIDIAKTKLVAINQQLDESSRIREDSPDGVLELDEG